MSAALNRVLLPRRDKRPCVCGTCVCGAHRCPGIIPQIPFEGETTYRVQYPAKWIDHQRPYAPQASPLMTPVSSSHFLTTNSHYSITKESLEHHNASPTRAIRPKETMPTALNVPFSGVTTHQAEYTKHRVPPPAPRVRSAQPQRSSSIQPCSGFLSFETTNLVMQGPVAAAVRAGAAQRPSPTIAQTTLATSTVPLEAATTYRQYFPPRSVVGERLSRIRRLSASVTSPSASLDDRDFVTTKQLHYQPIKVTNICPAVPFYRRPASADGHISIR